MFLPVDVCEGVWKLQRSAFPCVFRGQERAHAADLLLCIPPPLSVEQFVTSSQGLPLRSRHRKLRLPPVHPNGWCPWMRAGSLLLAFANFGDRHAKRSSNCACCSRDLTESDVTRFNSKSSLWRYDVILLMLRCLLVPRDYLRQDLQEEMGLFKLLDEVETHVPVLSSLLALTDHDCQGSNRCQTFQD
eukprot:755348-Hanusia_phi.AAC.5